MTLDQLCTVEATHRRNGPRSITLDHPLYNNLSDRWTRQAVRLGVLEPVPIGTPVTWCHRMVICAKKTGKLRRTVDFQPPNAHATRVTHHTQSPFHQARSVPHGKLKSVFDAWNGYHSVPLHADGRHYTTFITPWGRYRYCSAPQGYIASGDGYSRRYDEIVSDLPRKTKCILTTPCYGLTPWRRSSFFLPSRQLARRLRQERHNAEP